MVWSEIVEFCFHTTADMESLFSSCKFHDFYFTVYDLLAIYSLSFCPLQWVHIQFFSYDVRHIFHSSHDASLISNSHVCGKWNQFIANLHCDRQYIYVAQKRISLLRATRYKSVSSRDYNSNLQYIIFALI